LVLLEYRYRDAANFKALGRVKLKGTLSASECSEIVSKLEDGELFIAEQVGIPPLYESLYEYSNGPTPSDHCWHEFVAIHDCPDRGDDEDFWGTTDELLSRFRSVSRWDLRRSKHFEMCST
jgi:hypothetical protein